MYNNEVTYHDRWDTEENKVYRDKCYRLIRGKTLCMSDIPLAWSKELYELLSYLDKEFGLGYNPPFIFQLTLKNFFNSFVRYPIKHFFKKPFIYPETKDVPLERIKRRFNSFWWTLSCNWTRLVIDLKRRVVNKIRKPKVFLSQVKEKYGTLRVYYGCPEYLDKHIDKLIRGVEVKLSLKEAYFPLQELYDWGSTSWNEEMSYQVEDKKRSDYQNKRKKVVYQEVTAYNYRKIIKKHLPEEEWTKLVKKVKRKRKKNG